MKDTYWIVPPDRIYSVHHAAGENRFVVIRGQTVFHITDCFNGYFTGAVVVKITEGLLPNRQSVLDQVTLMGSCPPGPMIDNPLALAPAG